MGKYRLRKASWPYGGWDLTSEDRQGYWFATIDAAMDYVCRIAKLRAI